MPERHFNPQAPETPLPRQRYGLPILRVLVELGGSASTKQVLQQVFQLMEVTNELREIDKTRRSDGQFYWNNRTQDMRRELINKGFMKEDSPRGIWEISAAGREHLLNNGRN